MNQPPTRIPINDLTRSALEDRDVIHNALIDVADSGWYLKGTQTQRFEETFADYLGVDHCLGVGNGTDALELALRSLEIGPGSRVATVANAGFYTSTACLAVGALPFYVDVDMENLQMSPTSLKAALTEGVNAVVVTHLYGDAEAAPAIRDLCSEAGVPLIEDCAQAAGARLDGKRAGSFGDLATFSFYPTKNLAAIGDGGAVVTSDPDLASRLQKVSQYGWSKRYRVEEPGRNSRLDELQAAVLNHRLAKLDADNAKRRDIVHAYQDAMAGSSLRISNTGTGEGYVAHLAVVVGEELDELSASLNAAEIQTDVHYPVPDHQQPLWNQLGFQWPSLPNTETATHRILTLPCFPSLTEEEIYRVAEGIRNWLEKSDNATA